jgi:hypothetical protein
MIQNRIFCLIILIHLIFDEQAFAEQLFRKARVNIR